MFKIKIYKDKQGNEPIADYIVNLNNNSVSNKSDRIKLKKILEYISLLKKYGTRAGLPFVKHIEDDLWELRPIRDRIIFFYWKDDTFVLLHYFIKKAHKTPRCEIEQAKRNLKDFLDRSLEHLR
jgi:phage-related protein